MKKIKLALVGCAGRMGQQIIKELQNFSRIDLIAALEDKNSKFLDKKIKKINITNDKELAFKEVNTIIDFSQPESTLETANIFGFLAIILAAVNIFGGFLVTQRMLAMYKKKKKDKK